LAPLPIFLGEVAKAIGESANYQLLDEKQEAKSYSLYWECKIPHPMQGKEINTDTL
jgi:hypothetical protein